MHQKKSKKKDNGDLVKNVGVFGLILLLFYVFLQDAKAMISPSGSLKVRNDSSGQGHFGARRTDHIHEGVDFEVEKGQPVYAPFNGEMHRYSEPYQNDSKYSGCHMKGSGESEGYYCKIWYFQPLNLGVYKKGQIIGYAQAISEKYNGSMIDHLHFQLYKNDVLVDPLKHLK